MDPWSFLLGALGSFLLWTFYGLPKVMKAINREKVYFENKFENEKEWIKEEISKQRDFALATLALEKEEIGKVLTAEKNELMQTFKAEGHRLAKTIVEDMAPKLIDAFVTKGAQDMGERSGGSRSMAKHAINKGSNVSDIMAAIKSGDGASIMSTLTGIAKGSGKSPPSIQGLIGKMAAKKLAKDYIPKEYQEEVEFLIDSYFSSMGGSVGGNHGQAQMTGKGYWEY